MMRVLKLGQRDISRQSDLAMIREIKRMNSALHTHSLALHTHSLALHTHSLALHTHSLALHTHSLALHTHSLAPTYRNDSVTNKNLQSASATNNDDSRRARSLGEEGHLQELL